MATVMRLSGLTVLFLAFAVILLSPGCDTTSSQRLAAVQSALDKAGALSKDYDSRMAAIEPAIGTLTKMLADPNVTGATAEKIKATLADLQAKYATLKALKAVVDEKVTAYTAVIAKAQEAGDIDIGKELAVYGEGVMMIGGVLPPPFNAIAAGIGALLAAAGGVIGAVVKAKQAKQAQTTVVTGVVDSVSALLAKLPTKEQAAEILKANPGVVILDIETAKSILAREQVKVPPAAAAVREALGAQTDKVAA